VSFLLVWRIELSHVRAPRAGPLHNAGQVRPRHGVLMPLRCVFYSRCRSVQSPFLYRQMLMLDSGAGATSSHSDLFFCCIPLRGTVQCPVSCRIRILFFRQSGNAYSPSLILFSLNVTFPSEQEVPQFLFPWVRFESEDVTYAERPVLLFTTVFALILSEMEGDYFAVPRAYLQ